MNQYRIEYYMDIARTVASASSCARRKFGAVIVKEDSIVSTGYNGSVRGAKNCGTEMPCLKDKHNEKAYMSYNYCPAVHAEQNAVINAARTGTKVSGATLFLAPASENNGDRPCHLCRRTLINAGIKDCYYIDKDNNVVHEELDFWVTLEDLWMEKVLVIPK